MVRARLERRQELLVRAVDRTVLARRHLSIDRALASLPLLAPEPCLVGVETPQHHESLGTHRSRHGKHAIALGRGYARQAGELLDNIIGPADSLRSLVHVVLPALY